MQPEGEQFAATLAAATGIGDSPPIPDVRGFVPVAPFASAHVKDFVCKFL